MGVFNNFPYANFHELNADWIIEQVRKVMDEWEEYRTDMNLWKLGVDDQLAEFQAWFDNLDVQDEVRTVMNELILSGEFIEITSPQIVSATEAWLAAHITPTTPAVDDTLSISGAAADAKVTGDRITDLKEDLSNSVYPVMITGKSIYNNGGVLDNPSCDCSDFVKIYPGSKIALRKVDSGTSLGCCFYDAFKTFISKYTDTTGIGIDIETTAPANAYYVRVTTRTGVQPAIEQQGLYPYFIEPTFITVNKMQDDIDLLNNYLEPIADEEDLLYNGYIDASTGNVGTTDTWKYSDYIDIEGIDEITSTIPNVTSALTVGLAFYNSSKTFISGVAGETLTLVPYYVKTVYVPDNAKYVRFCFKTSEIANFYAKQDKIEKLINNEAVNTYGMQLFETIGVIGDSISVGWALNKNGVASRRNTDISWVQQMARRLGCTAYNLGASGVDPVEWFDPTFEFAQYCYTQYQSVGFCDLYIIGLGLNTATLGSISDINQSDYTQNANTFYGQYARIIQMINHDHPNAIVICVTEPTPAISTYDQAVRDICALNYINAELVDLENNYMGLFNTPEIIAEKQPDGIHYTPYGYSLIADAMVKAISDYISKNSDAFKYVGVV